MATRNEIEKDMKRKSEQDISGFKPKVIGNICDSCNKPIQDVAILYGYYEQKPEFDETIDSIEDVKIKNMDVRWMGRTTHMDCYIGLSDDVLNFSVECEVIQRKERENAIVLGNPQIKEINIPW